MGGCPPTHAVEVTLTAERVLLRPGRWAAFLKLAIDALADDPAPDGFSKLVAPAATGYSGCLMYEVFPWRVYYHLTQPARVVIVAVVPHPIQM